MIKRRGRLAIYIDLLRIISKNPTLPRTRTFQKANMNQQEALRYIEQLITNNLINDVTIGTRTQYRITTKGIQFITTYLKMLKLLDLRHIGET